MDLEMVLTLGILADKPTAATGFAIVNHNLAFNLAQLYHNEIRIIYFARFGIDKGVAPYSSAYQGYEIVDCEGGVWKTKTVEKLIRQYNVDIVYCQPSGVLVYGQNEIKPIEKMRVGDKVLTHKGNFKKIIRIFKYKYRGNLIWISADYGIKIPFSPEHKIFIRRFSLNGGQKLLVRASELKLGNDYIWIPFHKLHGSPFNIDKDFVRLMGYYIAEGSISKDGGKKWSKDGLISFSFGENEEKLYNDAISLIKKYWKPSKVKIKKVGRGCVAIRFYSRKIARWLIENCGKGAKNKHFPPFYLQLTNEQLSELLNGYMAGDGYRNTATTTSKILAHQLRLINLRFGKMIGISYNDKRKAFYCYERTKSKFARGILQKRGLWIKIRNIWIEPYNGILYNLEVEKDNSYVVEGVATHNSEDDWYSMIGLIGGTKRTKTPLYFLTPIDGLPIQKEAHRLFRHCRKIFVPNKSYKYIKNGVYLPHAVDWMIFRPIAPKKFDKFTFLWIGRDERRKALGRTILAFEKIYRKVDCQLVVRSNWGQSPMARGTARYIKRKRLPIILDKMADCPHEDLAKIYSSCHAYINSSKAGGCEMSILEAQACALPVLVTNWNFMSENVIDGKTGFLIPIDGYDIQPKRSMSGKTIEGTTGRIWGNISIDRLAEKMIWMVENPKKAEKMGLNGLFHIRKHYNWADVATKLYDTMMVDYETYLRKGKK